VGDVRDIANGKRLNTTSQQKIGNWGHGKLRAYISYKAEAAGITVELVDEAYSSQTCPQCRERHKPTGRVYRCPACGFVSHRDAVGSSNILSRHLHGQVGHIVPPSVIKYRQPFGRVNEQETEWALAPGQGKRSRLDTAEMASAGVNNPSRR
jgi:putative transposase